MPSSKKKLKLKAKKDKKSRRLSTEEILNLIKNLKPKTQQIVKVNVGDRGTGSDNKKKQASQVQSSYNPPFVFPANGQAITSLGQPPYQPPLMAVPREAPSWSAQPARISQPLIDPTPNAPEFPFERPPPLSRAISNESAYSDVPFIEPIGKSYKVRAPRTTKTSKKAGLVAEDVTESESDISFIEPRTFSKPRSYPSSSLGSSSAVPSYFNLPSENDKYQPDIINTNFYGDQIGTIANSVPSSEWTGSPEGDIVPEKTADPTAGAVASAGATDLTTGVPDVPEIDQPIETFSLSTPPEDIFIAPDLKPPKILEPIPPIQETKRLKASKSLPPVQNPILGKKTISDTVYEINTAIDQGYFKNLDWLPYKYTIKKGIDTGKMSSKITKDELTPIYAAFRVAMDQK